MEFAKNYGRIEELITKYGNPYEQVKKQEIIDEN